MKRSHRASQPAAQVASADGRSASCKLGTKAARGGLLKDLADQQMALEHSSEKSCQEHVAQGATGSLRGRAQKAAPMDGTSSQGSEASHSQEWQENGEETWQSATHSLEVSSRQDRTSQAAPVKAEEADASSAGPGDTHSAASTRREPSGAAAADDEKLPVILGSSASDKAAHARALADMAWSDARKKAKRAACLLAAAQHAAADELQPAKRRRQRSMRAYVGHPEHVLLGARISVYWPDDDAFYKGRIVEVRGPDDEARVIYDDDMEEWLALPQERFQWLAPRAQSAGGTPELQVEMAQLGAEGVLDTPHIPELPAGQLEQAPGAGEAVGGRVTVHFAGVGVWCRGEVLAYDPTREMHHVLYEDGENEWMCLAKEAHAWVPTLPGRAYPAGLPPGVAVPSQKEATGWRVAVYWPEGSTLYEGEIVGYDNVTGRHHVRYDSGDHEHVSLDAVKICWIMPPTVSTAASGAEAASMPSSPSGAASESLPRSWSACHGGSSSGNKPHRLKPVAELLPFDGDLLDEESALREAGAFPEDYAPDHAAHAAPALWWPHSAAQRSAPSALLVPELPTHHADSGQVLSGRPWGSHMGVCAAGKTSALHASGRSLSMPGPPFDDLMTELGGTCEEETPLSVELTTLDMQLPSMELTPDMQDMLMEPHESQEGAVVGGSTHGSGVYSSDLRSIDPVAMAGGEPAVEDFLRPDEDLAKHQTTTGDVHADTSSGQADGLLGAGRLSSKSMASDSTAVRFYLPCRNTLTSPAVSAAATPESHQQLPKWEMRQHCSTPTPAQALGLTPLHDPASPADALDASMAMPACAKGADELAMPTELQCLIAEMNWDV